MFCPKCGATVEDGKAFCPACGAQLNQSAPAQGTTQQPAYAQQPAYTQQPTQQTQQTQQNYAQNVYNAMNNIPVPKAPAGSANLFKIFSLVAGIVSIVFAFPFAIFWGIATAIPGIVLGAGAVVLAIIANNSGSKALPGLICGIVGLSLSFIFMIGCFGVSCRACGGTSYLRCGVVGGACTAANDVRSAYYSLF